MAKNKKTKNIFEIASQSENTLLSSNLLNKKNDQFDENISVLTNEKQLTIVDDISDSIEHIDKDAQISDLLNKNNELMSRISEYIEELDSLRNVKTQLDDVTNQLNNKIIECNKLKEDIDTYIMKISELSFQIAALQSNNNKNNSSSLNVQSIQKVNYNNNLFNGYSTWN